MSTIVFYGMCIILAVLITFNLYLLVFKKVPYENESKRIILIFWSVTNAILLIIAIILKEGLFLL